MRAQRQLDHAVIFHDFAPFTQRFQRYQWLLTFRTEVTFTRIRRCEQRQRRLAQALARQNACRRSTACGQV